MLLQKGKKLNILSLVVSLSMALNVAWSSIPVKAEVVFPITDKAELSVEFLGISEDNHGPASEAQKGGITEGDEGKVFWVGVAVKDAYKLTENFTASGIYSMDIAFDYNPEYIEPCSDMADSTGEKGNKTTWLETVKHFNLSQGVNSDDNLYWDSLMYEVVDSACVMNAEPDVDSHRESPPVDGHKMMFLTIKNNDGSGNARFKGLTAVEDTKYLIRVPFVVNKVPDDISGTVTDCLKLSLGPQTFVIGSGENGYESYGAWEKEDKTIPEVNLKNYFNWMGDFEVFQTATSQITDIQVYQYVDDSLQQDPENPITPKQYDIYKDVDMTEGNKGFASDTFEYYTAVDADTNEITLRILPDLGEGIKVNFNDGEITTIPDDSNDWINTGSIGELEIVDMEVNGGFNSTITVTNGDTVYTLHVRRYRKPEIVLNYGNSPVGMIMSDDINYPTLQDKEQAINEFKTTRIFGEVSPELNYYEDAWKSYGEYNGDDDPTAMFVFQRENFRDVGFTAYNSLGEEVDDSSVSIDVTVISFKGGFVNYDETDNPQDINVNGIIGNNYLFTEFKNYDIRPDVYDMTYTFTDSITGELVNEVRKLIVISKRGDVYMDATKAVNNIDATYITSNVIYFQRISTNSLYKFRLADANEDATKAINNVDATYVKANVVKGLPQFYKPLSSE